jgi:hypothetical protein
MLVEEYRGLTRTHGQEEGEYEFRRFVSGLRKKGMLNENTLSLRGILEGCMASANDPFGELAHSRYPRGMVHYHRGFFESLDAIGASTFSNIGGQLLIDKVRENYELAMQEVEGLVETRPNPAQNLGTHKDPWLSRVFEEPPIVNPGETYPDAHFIEQWMTMPPPEKRGEIIKLEMEMVYADKTKQALQRAGGGGEKLGLNKAKRILATVTGFSFTFGKYSYAAQQFRYNDTAYDVYATSGLWVNEASGVTVTNYSHITTVDSKFAAMTDLATGDPIIVNPRQRKVLCVWDKQWDLRGAMPASDARVNRGAFPTTGDNIQQQYKVPDGLMFDIVPSKLLYLMLTTMLPDGSNISAANALQHLWWGDFLAAFGYREVYPLQVIQAPPNNPGEFYQDIAVQEKVSEFGVAFAQGPQQAVHTYQA